MDTIRSQLEPYHIHAEVMMDVGVYRFWPWTGPQEVPTKGKHHIDLTGHSQPAPEILGRTGPQGEGPTPVTEALRLEEDTPCPK